MAAAQQGAEWAFAVLYRELNPRLLRYFAARAPGSAEDLAAETWLGAARHLGSFTGTEEGFRAWLFTIAHRRLVQHWREMKRRPPATGDLEAALDAESAPDSADAAVNAVFAQEAAKQIAAALSPDQAEVVLLRVLGGLDVDQVADILGKRPGSVRVLQHKALRRLAAENFSVEGVTR
jgi:RNA polymerase sigma-70 factor (ECF subfamily)